jgi:hypothetical protein
MGILGRKNEDDEIALGDVVFRNRLVIAEDGVRSGRIDDGYVLKDRPGQTNPLPEIPQDRL